METRLIAGVITRIVGQTSKVLTIQPHDGKTLQEIHLDESFCPATRGDIIWGAYIEEGSQNRFVQTPAIEIPLVEESIRKSIVSALHGTQFNRSLIDRIYSFFQEEALRKVGTTLSLARLSLTPSENKDAMVAEAITSFVEGSLLSREEALANLNSLGLNKIQSEKFLFWWRSRFTLRRLYLLGLTKKEIRECTERSLKAYTWEPSELHRQLTINPYRVEKVPLEKALQIVRRYFLRLPPEYAECGKIIRHIDQGEEKGWSCYPMYMLSKIFPKLFEYQTILKDVFRCRIRYNFIYLPHQAETEDILTSFLKSVPLSPTFPNPETKRKLSPQQFEAVTLALNNSVSIITGSGGTGKTTTLAQLCQELEFREISYIVAAFTGKAVVRIKQILQRHSRIMTLHMLLNRKIEAEVLIVDEASQVDNWLLASVIKKMKTLQSIVFVGDPRQLQSFNGDLLNQMIACGKIPRIELTEDHRRKTNGSLFQNMRHLAENQPELFEWGEDCHFIEGRIPELLSLVRTLAQGKTGKEITVICPYNKVNDELNQYLQDIFLPSFALSWEDSFGKTWKVGARVMLLNNFYDIGVMNGEEGEIRSVGPEHLEVLFGEKEVKIPTFLPQNIESEDSERIISTKALSLSWAITPDKGQGSQWDSVVCYFPFEGRNLGFLHKKRGYTAMARASKELFVIADSESQVRQMFITEPGVRYDNLSRRLQGIPFQSEYVTSG